MATACDEKVVIRSLKPENAKVVAGLIRQLTPRIVEPEKIEDRIRELADCEGKNFQYIVAELNGHVVGSSGLHWYLIPSKGLMGWIEELVVDEGGRGKGAGALMLDELLQLAEDLELAQVKLTTGNLAARHIYEKAGFVFKDEELLVKKYY